MKNIEQLEKALNSGDEEARRETVELLLQGSSPDALRLLIKAAGDESWRVRKTAVEALLTFPDPAAAIQGLVHGLHAEDNAGLRNASVETLIRMGETAVPALLEHIETANEEVRRFVIDILGGIADPRAVPALVDTLEDPNENVRFAAAENLGLIGNEDAVDALLACLRRDDLQLQYCALRALASIGTPVPLCALEPLLEKQVLTKPVLECLGNSGEPRAVDLLVTGLGYRSAAIRGAAASSLARIFTRRGGDSPGEPLVEQVRRAAAGVEVGVLCEDLAAPDPNRRISAAVALGLLGDSAATLSLIEAATDESVTTFALDAILRIGGPARETIVANFSALEDGGRAVACAALGDLGGPSVIPALFSALEDDSAEVRAAAAGALGKIGNLEGIQGLGRMLEDESPEVREAAVNAIVALGAGHSREVLRVLSPLREQGQSARSNLVRVLGRMGADEGAGIVENATHDENAEVRRAALEALGRLGFARFEENFQIALTDESPEVRTLTAELWGSSGLPRATDNLILMLQDEDLWVRCAALRGLGSCGDARAIDALRELLPAADGVLMITALEAIFMLAGDGALGDLTRALEHRDPEVVKMALQTLGHVTRFPADGPLEGALGRLLGHADGEVRLAAARFAASHPRARLLPALREAHGKESDPAVLEMMRHAMEKLNPGDASGGRRSSPSTGSKTGKREPHE